VAVAQRWPLITSSAPKRRVELVEKEVYTVLGDGGEGDPKRWIFDTGASNHMTGIKEAFTEYVQAGQPEVVIMHHEEQAASPVPGAGEAASPIPRAGAAASPVPGRGAASPAAAQVTLGTAVMHASPPADAGMQLDANHDDEAPLRFRTLRNIDDAGPAFGLTQPEPMADLLMVDTEEPASFQEAQAHECWRQAMLDEMTAIEANGTWKLEEAPAGIRPIGLKWVFKTKRDAVGNISKYKARLVVKGYVQQQGVDFDEVFAPVARLESVRLLLAYAVGQGWPIHHMDVPLESGPREAATFSV
jgi:hypothetical protein